MLARSSTLNGGCIMTLTRISRIIQWFRFLFYMKILHKESEQQPTEKDIHIEAAAIRSEAIDRTLQEDATTLRHETKLVLIGNINSGKELIVHQMKTFYAEGHYSNKDREGYRYAVRSTVRVLMHSIIDLLKDTGITLPPELNQQFAILLHEVETSDPQRITAEAVRAVEKIWFCPEFSTLYIRNFEIDFPQYAPYFTQQLPRIARSDYVPNEADIVRLNLPHSGIKELRFNWDELDVHLFNIHGFIPDHFRKRWFHQLEDATSLMFTVDVSQYDRPYLGQATESQLLADFATFESWASSEKFANSSIILVLNNFTRFLEKLPYSPLEKFFSDFVPNESDPESSARQYILRRFKNMNRNHLSIYSFWVDLDMSDNQPLYAALKKTLQHDQQRRAKSEVGSASTLMTSSGSRSGNALASKHSRSRSGTLSGNTLGTGGSRVISPVQSDKIA
jgi:guanine nucleotide-binding protein G(i) subunit alpha